MINEIIRLVSGATFGTFATLINIKQNPTFEDTMNSHLGLANSLLALIIGMATLIFLFYQIEKIRIDLKEKRLKKK